MTAMEMASARTIFAFVTQRLRGHRAPSVSAQIIATITELATTRDVFAILDMLDSIALNWFALIVALAMATVLIWSASVILRTPRMTAL